MITLSAGAGGAETGGVEWSPLINKTHTLIESFGFQKIHKLCF